MIYKKNYGQTGKKVSSIGFGGMRFPNDCSIEEGAMVVRRASQLGINYFDTAPFYCENRSEDMMGEAFRDMPNPFFLYLQKAALIMSQTKMPFEEELKSL